MTETLLAEPAKIEELRAAVLGDIALLEEAIAKSAADLTVVHTDTEYDVEDTNVTSVSITELRIVAFGSGECTLAFEAEVETENRLVWSEWDADHDETVTEKQWVIETSAMTGSAKVAIASATSKICAVSSLALDQDFVEVDENPRHRW